MSLEPSCLLTIKEDYAGLLGNRHNQSKVVGESSLLFEQFLDRLNEMGQWTLFQNIEDKEKSLPACIKVHTHCYQKASVGSTPTTNVLKTIPGVRIDEIPAGCCGMAGAFGYEKEHAELSMRIGELVLFPSIRNSKEGTWIVANGTSCRTKILSGTQQQALHIAEVLARILDKHGKERQ